MKQFELSSYEDSQFILTKRGLAIVVIKPKINSSIFFFALFSLLCSFPNLYAQVPTDSFSVQPLRITKDFDINATLTNTAWDKAPSVYIKYQVQPNDNDRAQVQTEVKVMYTADNLYIGFISEDPYPQEIRANVSDRDNSFQDDFVGVFLDPFNNNQHAYEFFVNPLGIQMDGMRTGNNEDLNFDLLWYSKGAITDSGYKVAMKIPFKSLSFPGRKVQHWSVQFIRNYPRNSRYQFSWTDVDLSNSCLLCQNGTLTGIEGIENTNTIELLPYGMSYQSSTINNTNDLSSGLDHDPVDARFGGSFSYSPSSTTSLNVVVNPDFSQIETDATQIGVNETFALFYPEKRPFFMKGNDLFSTQEDLFYSRTINRPLAAGKFIRQSSNYSLAFLTAYDRNAPFVIPGLYGSSQIQSEADAYSNILRGKYNFGAESHVGGLITTRNQRQGSSYVGSIDWRLLMTDHYYFSGQIAYSNTKELNDTTLFNDPRTFGQSNHDAAFNGQQFGGSLISAELSREAKYYNFSFKYTSFSPTFQAQDGFINSVDRRLFEGSQSYSYYPDTKWLSSGSVSVHGNWRYDFAGQFQERFIFVRVSNSFGGQTNLAFTYLPLNDEQFRGYFFTNMKRMRIELDSNPLATLSFGGHIESGRFVYRTGNPTVGHGYIALAFATLKPASRLELSLDYTYSTLSSLDDSQNFFSGDIFRMTGRYNFSQKLFARLIGQYDSFDQQIQIYPLLYYKINPFTKFYIGMTDYMNKYDQPGPDGFNGYKETDRQFFVKFQYLIRS